LSFDLLISGVLMIGFAVLIFGGSLYAADRVFTVHAGARTERVTTITKENIFVRNVRKIGDGPFGILMATNLKDYFRKAQNLSKLFYGLVLATILPIMMTFVGDLYPTDGSMPLMEMVGVFGMMFALAGGFPHAGIAFLESRDQLWILQGTPHGATKYVKSRVAMAALTDVFITMIPAAVITVLFGLDLVSALTLYTFGLIVVTGSSMTAIGVTARNPDYEDTKSPAHQANVMMAMMIPMFAMMGSIFSLVFMAILDVDVVIEGILGHNGFEILFTMMGPIILMIVASVLLVSGIRNLSSPE